MLTVYDKIQNACFQLNHDAYVLQVKNKKRLRQFAPCEKSLVLLACLREETHFGTAMMHAAMTHCNCHQGVNEDQLYAMCFDSVARENHYTGPSRHLTPHAPDVGKRAPLNPLSTPEVDSDLGKVSAPRPTLVM